MISREEFVCYSFVLTGPILSVRKFLLPGPVIEPNQRNQCGQKENIEDYIAYADFSLNKEESEINTERHIKHHPGDAVKYGPGNFF
jgi:hypothetical protein